MTWHPTANAYVKKDHLIFTKTNVSKSELEKMSSKEVDKIYRARAMKKLLSNGYSFTEADRKMKSLTKKTKSEQIAIIARE